MFIRSCKSAHRRLRRHPMPGATERGVGTVEFIILIGAAAAAAITVAAVFGDRIAGWIDAFMGA